MRFPYLHKVTRDAPSGEGSIHALAAIQRHVNGVERFFVYFEFKRHKQYPLHIAAPLPHHYPGLRDMAKLAPLHEIPIESGAPLNAESVLLAAVNNPDQSSVLKLRVTRYLRISAGVYRQVCNTHDDANLTQTERVQFIQSFLDSLNVFWKKQADMAAAFIRGEIDNLTNYPVYVKLRPGCKS